jgi:hypothetical protein
MQVLKNSAALPGDQHVKLPGVLAIAPKTQSFDTLVYGFLRGRFTRLHVRQRAPTAATYEMLATVNASSAQTATGLAPKAEPCFRARSRSTARSFLWSWAGAPKYFRMYPTIQSSNRLDKTCCVSPWRCQTLEKNNETHRVCCRISCCFCRNRTCRQRSLRVRKGDSSR